ncbi:unnamed protein product [Boreogadus saida]
MALFDAQFVSKKELTLSNDMSLSFFSPPPPPACRISSLGWRVKEVEEDYFKSWPPAKSLDQDEAPPSQTAGPVRPGADQIKSGCVAGRPRMTLGASIKMKITRQEPPSGPQLDS